MKRTKITAAIVLSGMLVGCFPYTVDEGELALVTKYGEIIETKTSGLGWSSMIEDVTKFSIREQKQVFGKYDDQGDVVGGFAAYTRDTQTVVTGLTVTYKLTDPVQTYKLYRTTENMVNQLIEPRTRQAIEIVFSQYSAQQALENRAKLTTDITQAVREAVKNYPIEITAVQSIIQFNKEYEKRVEESVQKNVAIQTAERQVAIDRKEAESRLVKAQAEADADIIRAKGEALKENQQLVSLTAAEKWNGVLPTTMTPNGSVPFVQVGAK